MEMAELASKEISRMGEVIGRMELLDEKGKGIFVLAKTYFTDSKHFLETKDFVRAFEAVIISWAYVDAGLHLGVIGVPEELKCHFTA